MTPSSFLCLLPLVLAAGALSVPAAQAQQATVRGFVTDSETEQALQGASVVLQTDAGVTYGTATDGDGYFILRRLPTGAYTLAVTFVGYTPYQEPLTLGAGATVQRQVALAPQPEELEEVVVQAEGESGVTAVAAGLQSVVPAQIERVPMPGVTGDLASYLQTVPGVVTQGDRGGQFFVRGGSVDQNLALIDGLPVYLPFHILSFYSAFPQEIIDTADLYTGGFGARYGARISSVLDVETRRGNKQKPAGEVSLAPFLSTARIEGPLIKDRVSFIGSVRQSFIEEVFPNLFGQRMPYRFGDRFGKLHAFLNSSHSFSLMALHTSDRGDLAGTRKRFDGEALSTALTDSNEVAWDNLVLGGRYVFLPSRLPLLVEVIAGRSAMTNTFGPSEAPERTSEIRSVDAAAHFRYFLHDSEVRFGAALRASTLSYELGGQFQDLTSNEEDLTEVNAYVETDLAFAGARLHVEPGLHLYALPDRSRQWVEPRVRASFRPGGAAGRQQFNVSGGLFHQTLVGLNDERDVGNVFTAWVTTPDDRPVQEARHVIAGWSMRLTPWLSVASEGFYKAFENLSVPIFSAFPRFTTALQTADGTARGVDLRVDLRDRLLDYEIVVDGYVSYSLSEVEYETAQLVYHPAHDRRHQVNALFHAQRRELGLTIQYQFGSGLPFTASAGFDVWHLLTPAVDVASDPGSVRVLYSEPFGDRQPEYHRVDVWLERRIDRGRTVATLRAGAVNVFNRDNLFYYDLFTLNRVDQLPLFPSVGFKLELR